MQNKNMRRKFSAVLAAAMAVCMLGHGPVLYAEEAELQTEAQTEIQVSTTSGSDEVIDVETGGDSTVEEPLTEPVLETEPDYGMETEMDEELAEQLGADVPIESVEDDDSISIQEIVVGEDDTSNVISTYATTDNIIETPEDILSLSAYSLSGAKYGIYTSSTCTSASLVATLTTTSSGTTESEALPWSTGQHTVWIKEIKAPAGHKLNPTAKRVDLDLDNLTGDILEFTMADEPLFATMDAMVQKMSAKGNPIGGVVFEVKLYDGKYDSPEKCPEEALKKTWYLKSNEDGELKVGKGWLADDYAESDSFYTYDNQYVIPIGCTLTFQEKQAPAECIMDDTIQIWKESNEKIEVARFYNKLEPSRIRIKKFESDGKTPLAGVKFQLTFVKQAEKYTNEALKEYAPLLKQGESKVLTTDENGELAWENLDQGEEFFVNSFGNRSCLCL